MQGKSKLFSIILFSLLGVSALLGILFMFEKLDAAILLGWCYLLLIVSTALAVIFPILIMAQNPKKARSAGIGILALLLVLGLGYAFATGGEYQIGDTILSESVAKRSEAGLIAFYILIIGAIGAIVYSEISKAFK